MNVLLLTPRPQLLSQAIVKEGDDYEVSMGIPDLWPTDVDYIVSFGYRHKINEPYLTQYKDRLINIHTSMLPWNRGADPNFWSWFDNTPKGVSVHLVEKALDKGPIIGQMEITKWTDKEDLQSSWNFLNQCASKLFSYEWPRWRNGDWFFLDTVGEGSYHKSTDKDKWMGKLPLKFATPVVEVEMLGAKNRVN
jgi:methionyl-tRNA formyltransferase